MSEYKCVKEGGCQNKHYDSIGSKASCLSRSECDYWVIDEKKIRNKSEKLETENAKLKQEIAELKSQGSKERELIDWLDKKLVKHKRLDIIIFDYEQETPKVAIHLPNSIPEEILCSGVSIRQVISQALIKLKK